MVGVLFFGGCSFPVSWCDLGVTFDLGFAKMFPTATFHTWFSYHKAKLIAVTDYCIYFNLILLPPLTAIFQINRSVDNVYSFFSFSLQINAVILLLNCLFWYFVSPYFLFLSVISLVPLHSLHCLFGKTLCLILFIILQSCLYKSGLFTFLCDFKISYSD